MLSSAKKKFGPFRHCRRRGTLQEDKSCRPFPTSDYWLAVSRPLECHMGPQGNGKTLGVLYAGMSWQTAVKGYAVPLDNRSKAACVQEVKTTSATWYTGTVHLWSCNLLGAVERSILSRDLLSYLIDSVSIYLIPLTECSCIHSFPGDCFMCYSAVGRVYGSPLDGPAVSGLCWGATLSNQLHLPDWLGWPPYLFGHFPWRLVEKVGKVHYFKKSCQTLCRQDCGYFSHAEETQTTSLKILCVKDWPLQNSLQDPGHWNSPLVKFDDVGSSNSAI